MMKKWKIECIIYDCDGVLFDSLEVNKLLYNRIASAGGRKEPLTDDEIHYCHTHTVYESIHHIFIGNEEKEATAMKFWKDEIDLRQLVSHLKMEPHLMETLKELKDRKINLAICTNRTNTMPSIMEQFGLGKYFPVVVTALDVLNPKPHPESVNNILESFNVPREKALYIGDSMVDVQTARSSGVRFIAYKNRTLDADDFIDDHLEVFGFLSNE